MTRSGPRCFPAAEDRFRKDVEAVEASDRQGRATADARRALADRIRELGEQDLAIRDALRDAWTNPDMSDLCQLLGKHLKPRKDVTIEHSPAFLSASLRLATLAERLRHP